MKLKLIPLLLIIIFSSVGFANDEELLKKINKEDVSALKTLSDNKRKDKNFFLLAVKKNPESLLYAHNDLKKDKDFILSLLKVNGTVLNHIDLNLKNDKELIYNAFKSEPNLSKYKDKNLNKYDRAIGGVKDGIIGKAEILLLSIRIKRERLSKTQENIKRIQEDTKIIEKFGRDMKEAGEKFNILPQ